MKKYIHFISGLFLCAMLIISCSEGESRLQGFADRLFQRQSRLLCKQGDFIIKQMEARSLSSPAAKPYFDLGQQLNNCFYSVIDSSQMKSTCNTDSLGKVLTEKYNAVIDLKKKSIGYKLFLASEEPFVYMKNPADSAEKNNYQNFVLNAQFEHLRSLQILRLSYADYAEGFTIITETGPMIHTYVIGDKTNFSLYFRYPNKVGRLTALGNAKILSEEGKSVSINKFRISNDTMYFETSKLIKAKYKVIADYLELNLNGYETKKQLEFPFSISE